MGRAILTRSSGESPQSGEATPRGPVGDLERLKDIPSVDSLAAELGATAAGRRTPRRLLVRAARSAVESVRDEILSDGRAGSASSKDVRARARALALGEMRALSRRRLSPVLNATGVIVHTNLGRAPLSERAIQRVSEVSAGYSTLEYDLAEGDRGHRGEVVTDYLRELTGAEDALVVNNNAAAVLLALNTLALGREVVVSRSELIEIGGSFRLPEVFERSGARMVAVGTTNRTRPGDYENAIRNSTAAIMAAHWSNYSISGFVQRVELRDLSDICERAGLPLIHDLGSGLLADAASVGLEGEASIADSLAGGADVVTASGDKMLGGPQAGIALGRVETVGRMRANPLMRAMRPGKLTLAALEATLEAYLEDAERDEVPVIRALVESRGRLVERATELAGHLRDRCGGLCSVEVVETTARVGGGAAPERDVASAGLSVSSERMSTDALARRLRDVRPPVIARATEEGVVLDLRTIAPEDDAAALDALVAALATEEE
ncbi:MAG: L-seryl-tRNA(Sec) selenium transferase [Candidatus Eisenbacteria bacterium]|nr:L-seryl-tRNA(Sec) selenium transferase [Candidatus Eisenbacteria bacterium]